MAVNDHDAFPGVHRESGDPRSAEIRPTVRAVLSRLEPTPALVINRICDIVAWNSGGKRLFGPVGLLDGSPPNVNRFLFTDPRARDAFPDWDRTAEMAILQLRLGDCPETQALITELTRDAGSEFTDLLNRYTEPGSRFGELPFHHPTAGPLRLAYETLDLSIVEPEFLVVCLPGDDQTRKAFDGLAESP